MKKLLVISPAKSFGGGEMYLTKLLPELAKRYEVTVAAPVFATKLFAHHAQTVWLPLFPAFLDRMLKRTHRLKQLYYRLLLPLYRLGHYDLVSVQWFDGELIEAIKTHPLLMTLHTGFLIPRKHDEYVSRVMKNVNQIICVSEQAKQQLVDRGVEPDKCLVVYNGIDINKIQPGKKTGQYITWVGRVEQADKNPDLFVEVARLAQNRNLNYKFRMVGYGRHSQQIKQNAPSNLQMSGFVHPEKMDAVYREASVLCMTSTSEGMPFVAIEAMARGIPVVATSVGGLNDLLAGGAGILVNNFEAESMLDALRSVVDNPKRHERLSSQARQKIEAEFALPATIKQTVEVYKKTVLRGRS